MSEHPFEPAPLYANFTETSDAPETTGTPYTISVGDTFSGTLGSTGDRDWVAVTLTAGEVYSITMIKDSLEDPYLRLYDSTGSFLTENDDGAPFRSSQLTFEATYTGTYYLSAGAWDDNYTGTYTLDVQPLPTFTYSEIADQLVNTYWESSFREWRAFSLTGAREISVDVTNLTADGQFLALTALDAWSDVTGISFVQVGSGAQITFDDDQTGAFSNSNTIGNTITSSTVNVSSSWLTSYGATLDTYSFQTYIHEIGHALGLGHAGNYNGSATFNVDNDYTNDSWQATIMSYFDQVENTFIDADKAYILTPMIADILAITTLYGDPGNQRTGDTTYGENSTAGGYLDTLTGYAEEVAYTILDSAGTDTLDFRSDTQDQVIDLAPGGISDVYGLRGNVSIALNTVIENFVAGSGNDSVSGNAADNALNGRNGNDTLAGDGGRDTLDGGSGNDSLLGGAANDFLIGGAGNDTLDGSAGYDTADYSGATENIVVNINWHNPQTVSASLGADTLLNIEGIEGGAGNDLLVGNAAGNVIRGGGGNDDIYGIAGADILQGEAGDDRIEGSGANDTMDGGSGTDTLNYYNAAGGVRVNLNYQGTAQNVGGSMGIDLFAGFENLFGSNGHGDILIGDAGGNVMLGYGGPDTIYGAAGNDTLYGMQGGDMLVGGSGSDTLFGGGGNDRFIYNATAESIAADRDRIADFGVGGDVIDLSAIDANILAAGNQAFSFIGSIGFSGLAGELCFFTDGVDGVLMGDVNGDLLQDFEILLSGVVSMAANELIV